MFRDLEVSILESLSDEIANIETTIDDDFKIEFEKVHKEGGGDISFLQAFGKPFDVLNAGLFSILTQEFEKVTDLVDDELIRLTKHILAKRSNDYQITFADQFLLKWILLKGKLLFISDEIANQCGNIPYFESVIRQGDIRIQRLGSTNYSIAGRIKPNEPEFLSISGLLDAMPGTFTVSEISIVK
ncbi:MAG: hypothetical protein JNM27_13655 [Leptospirales bacterium]|nr:hypothetical protein [Leptospirales bacterium]